VQFANKMGLKKILRARGCAMQFRANGATSVRQGQWFLHHDNAPSHTSPVLQQFLAEKNIHVITQPPYSSDLAPCDLWLFSTLKMGLKEAHFASAEDIKWSATAELRKIPKEAFRRCFQQRQDPWSKCVFFLCAQVPILKVIR
jgi:transposase